MRAALLSIFLAALVALAALFALTTSIASASGATWTNETASTSLSGLDWSSIASSADGTKLVAVIGANTPGYSGDIYTSANGGETWTDDATGTAASNLNWTSVTSSSDGTHLAAVETNWLGTK